jgi:dihydroxyacetone kinase
MELNIVCRALAAELSQRGLELLRLWSGLVMTSLDMAGFSITLLGVADDERGADILALLDSPTAALAWPGGSSGEAPELRLVPVPEAPPVPPFDGDHDDRTRAAIDAICLALLDQEAELTRLDQVVGDGDLGTALARGARAWLRDPIDGSAAQLLHRLSEHARREIGGTSVRSTPPVCCGPPRRWPMAAAGRRPSSPGWRRSRSSAEQRSGTGP